MPPVHLLTRASGSDAHRTPTGRCTLVGAGPGDPELLTLKAVKAIQSATLLLVDDLVSDEVLALATSSTRVVRVGKRGGCVSTPQALIDQLILRAVRQGEHVVRLKGGDPFVFGRGGEEMAKLKAQGVQVEVVNGITAGLAGASSLGVPWTHRDHAQGVVLVTGHAQDGQCGVDFALLARTAHAVRLTLVIYMGVGHVQAIAQALMQGLPASTPVAVIENASLPQQRQACCSLQTLVQTMADQGLGSPSVLVVGDVLKGLAALSTENDTALAPQALRRRA